MEFIQNKAMLTYQKNLAYFAKEQKELSKLLTIFEMALNNGDYKEQFDLEYKEGSFDIKEFATDKYLYSGDSIEISQKLTKLVNYRKDSLIFEGFPIYNFSKMNKERLDESLWTVEGVLPMMQYYLENSNESDSMQKIEKFIFIGVGLGLHIPMVHEKISAKEYLIVEDNLELFRLSLFTTEYYTLAQEATLFFSISDDENIFLRTAGDFLDQTFFNNRYLKYIKFPTHSDNKLKQLQNAVSSQSFIYFSYKAILLKYLKPLEYINDDYNMLNISRTLSSNQLLDKPVLLLAAGPSFQKNLEWIKENQKKFIIFSISAISHTLYKNDITPNFIAHLDGFDRSVKPLDDIPLEFFKNTIFLFGPNTPKIARQRFSKEQIFYFDEGAGYVEGFGNVSSACIGSTNLILSVILNAKNIYTIGLDLAVNQETGETHASGHLYNTKNDITKKDDLSHTMEQVKNLFPVQGNFQDTIYTNSVLHRSVQSLYFLLPRVKKEDQRIYNLSEGAKIDQTIPLHIEDVVLNSYKDIDKTMFFENMKETLLANSVKHLNESDTNAVKERLTSAKEIYKLLQEYSNNVSHSNKEKYLYDLLGIVSNILHKQDPSYKNITYVYYNFFKFTLAIIVDFFNSKELKNSKRHIKKLDKMIQFEMYAICDLYINSLEEFIKKRC
ncbi:MAG: motility associated factor glycosyltransferase family protein [Epsilonproteobacteria bacterium]|nr:motility associated factor glycosyltransferase family protein [Campylobacterota bacterium]OIO14216.1 MAG: hypothetical protein AUJ81_09875 [Helicobacteraceae bacterium CG1_02_36_14]PIP09937.1 MAG: hypothetical protein COX50_08380 [Sulfurimonas sp. CG23_combo_of_CG06-09_8_20_14_all_36_33]PIS26890.1 MAG: hypothetical protein COT46_00915 [Sulfurimonas sp. CG08_land_8_20_14_0_20_36_33]PIU34705.1 MAG: hypothetical protein COT05_06495 [Sulfurimonas sp. CG07_land_8_20_14_0_80_36_56]PIV03599.1 MAG: